jgi:flagellar motor protein MotB
MPSPSPSPSPSPWATAGADLRSALAAYVAAYGALQSASGGQKQQAQSALSAARAEALAAAQLYDLLLRYRGDAACVVG